MINSEFFMYYRAIIVSIIASLSDIGLMYQLNMVTKLNEDIILAISSMSGVIIQFFGQKLWTFKNQTKSNGELIKQILLFFGLELSLIACVIYVYDKSYNMLENKILELLGDKKNIITKHLFEGEGEGRTLSTIGKIILKSGIVFLTFNIISYPLWKYVIFVKK